MKLVFIEKYYIMFLYFHFNLFYFRPDEMYYFAPKNPQNNKSSIVGQRLDVTIFEDFLNTAPVKYS